MRRYIWELINRFVLMECSVETGPREFFMEEMPLYLVDIDLRKLKERAKRESFFCFGGGKMLQDLFRACPIENSVEGIIDNDSVKWGSFFSIREKSIPIMSLEQAVEQGAAKKKMLLTVSYLGGVDIMEQLRGNAAFKDVSLYWVLFLTEEIRQACRKSLPSNFRLSREQMIPKIIHYCWFGETEIPFEQRRYIEDWGHMCPGYEIVCWNESNYDIRKNHYAFQAYQAGAWAFVSDYVRKDVLYEYGGIYLDTDVEIVRPLDELLYQQGFCGFDDNKINSGMGMGARRGLPIMETMRDAYRGHEFDLQSRKHMKTGPEYETEILMEHGLRTDESYQVVADMTVYPPEVLSSAMIYSDGWTMREHTYTVHHFAGSWVDPITKAKWEKMRCLYHRMKENSMVLL